VCTVRRQPTVSTCMTAARAVGGVGWLVSHSEQGDDRGAMRELWGTFSVRDHLEQRPFVADVMLYDRLVVPFPADRAEWDRWEQPEQDWDPARQRRVLDVLRRHEQKQQLVVPIPWDEHRRQAFRDTFTAARAGGMEVDGYRWTAGQLLRDEDVKRAADAGAVKPRVVAAYVSRNALEQEVSVEEITAEQAAGEHAREQQLAIAVGRSFLVPDIDGEPSEERDLELLERAVRLATKDSFRQKRSAYNDWVERAVRERLTSKEAVAKMNQLLQAYEGEVKREMIGTRVEQAFLVTGVAVAVAGHFFPPLWVGGVLLAPARYLIGRQYRSAATPNDPSAMFHEARRELSLAAHARKSGTQRGIAASRFVS
jgi:hypothetical protein